MDKKTIGKTFDETARIITEDIQNMSNYKALYNEIQVPSSREHLSRATKYNFEFLCFFFLETRCVARRG